MARSSVEEADILDQIDTDPVADDQEPPFAMAKGMSIPVPKKIGSWWREKISAAQKVYEMEHQKWDAIFDHYRRCGDEGNVKNENGETYRYHHKNNTDENIIRNNIRTIMRSTYMRNPHLEFTGSETDKELTACLQYVVSFLMNKQTHPGLNLKPKARRWIMHGQLTNFGVMRLDFQGREGSLEEAQKSLAEIEEKLAKAKTKDELDTLYAQLQLLYEQMPLLQGKGILLNNVLPHRVIIDPDCSQIDLSDCKWLAEEVFLDRDYIDEKYYFKEGEERFLRSKPDVSKKEGKGGDKTVEDAVVATVLNDQTEQRREYVEKNKVRCWFVYDKTTRRVFLFNSEDWEYPLWVYEDDLKLSRFFRHFIISFSESIDSVVQPGEASFYVGQVNTINQINRKAQQIRNSVFGAILYDKNNADVDEIKKLINHIQNPDEIKAFGVAKTGSEKKISEMLEVLVPPAAEYQQMFDTRASRSAIDKAQAISDVDRGEQFKANTTNDAVQYMAENKQASTNQLIEIIEDTFESLGWALTEILVSKYSKDDITELVGANQAAGFQPMTVLEFNQRYRMQIAAGSIEKPNTQFKKQEAVQIAQAVGQFGQAAPGTSMRIIIRMFKEAFSNFNVTDEDWATLEKEVTANLQKGVSTNAGQVQQ
jgi:hypothetical protein